MEDDDARYTGGGDGCIPACHPFLSFVATAASTAALALCLTNRQRGYHHHHDRHNNDDGGGSGGGVSQAPWNVTAEGPWGEPLCPPWDDPDSTLPLLRVSWACLVALAACSILGTVAGRRCSPTAAPAESQRDRGRRQRRHRRTVRGGTIESGEPYEEIGAAPSEGEPMRVHPHAPRQPPRPPSPHGGPGGGGDGPNPASPGHAVLEAGGEAARAGSGRGIRGIGSRVGRDGEIEFHFHGEYAIEPPGSVGATATAEAASTDDHGSPQGDAGPSKLRRALCAASRGVGLVLLSYSAQLPTQQCALVLCTTMWCISVEEEISTVLPRGEVRGSSYARRIRRRRDSEEDGGDSSARGSLHGGTQNLEEGDGGHEALRLNPALGRVGGAELDPPYGIQAVVLAATAVSSFLACIGVPPSPHALASAFNTVAPIAGCALARYSSGRAQGGGSRPGCGRPSPPPGSIVAGFLSLSVVVAAMASSPSGGGALSCSLGLGRRLAPATVGRGGARVGISSRPPWRDGRRQQEGGWPAQAAWFPEHAVPSPSNGFAHYSDPLPSESIDATRGPAPSTGVGGGGVVDPSPGSPVAGATPKPAPPLNNPYEPMVATAFAPIAWLASSSCILASMRGRRTIDVAVSFTAWAAVADWAQINGWRTASEARAHGASNSQSMGIVGARVGIGAFLIGSMLVLRARQSLDRALA